MLVKTYYSTGHFDVFDTATLVDEIGRASCRERVLRNV